MPERSIQSILKKLKKLIDGLPPRTRRALVKLLNELAEEYGDNSQWKGPPQDGWIGGWIGPTPAPKPQPQPSGGRRTP